LGLVADLSANLIEAFKQTILDVFVLPRGGKDGSLLSGD
jgi:hypothetical protein